MGSELVKRKSILRTQGWRRAGEEGTDALKTSNPEFESWP